MDACATRRAPAGGNTHVRNCAGGSTDHDSWLSCEESEDTTNDGAGNSFTHGWVFDIPAVGTANGKPLKADLKSVPSKEPRQRVISSGVGRI